jgi:hypothetical protein
MFLATENFGALKDKEDLKILQAVFLFMLELPKRFLKKESKEHGALDNKSCCGQKKYLY